jgi:molybdenum cofactor cytidylyltransferase
MMSEGLVALLQPRELVAFVGAGGKTMLMLGLADQLTAQGRTVVVTTTTKMSFDEVRPLLPPLFSSAPAAVESALGESGPVLLLVSADGPKVGGPPPGDVDRIFRETSVEYLLVEADGAQRRPLKAPAPHEPVIPPATTLVVIVTGAHALGAPIADAAHRPELVAELTGRRLGDPVTPDVVATVVGHPAGGLQGVPHGARAVVAITGIAGYETRIGAAQIAALLADHARIERVVPVGPSAGPG